MNSLCNIGMLDYSAGVSSCCAMQMQPQYTSQICSQQDLNTPQADYLINNAAQMHPYMSEIVGHSIGETAGDYLGNYQTFQDLPPSAHALTCMCLYKRYPAVDTLCKCCNDGSFHKAHILLIKVIQHVLPVCIKQA